MSRTLLDLESFLERSEAMACAAVAQKCESLVEIGEQRGALANQLPADLGATLHPAEQTRARTIIEPVSYTHLDVYKRQYQHKSQ